MTMDKSIKLSFYVLIDMAGLTLFQMACQVDGVKIGKSILLATLKERLQSGCFKLYSLKAILKISTIEKTEVGFLRLLLALTA